MCDHGWTGFFCSEESHDKGGSSGNSGAVAGGVVGALAAVGIAGVVFYKRDTIKMWMSRRGRWVMRYRCGGGKPLLIQARQRADPS